MLEFFRFALNVDVVNRLEQLNCLYGWMVIVLYLSFGRSTTILCGVGVKQGDVRELLVCGCEFSPYQYITYGRVSKCDESW